MIAIEPRVKIAAKLYEMRDSAKLILGDKYQAKMAEFGKIIRMTAERDRKNVIQVAIEACKRPGADAVSVMMIIAAAVELTEPSSAQKEQTR